MSRANAYLNRRFLQCRAIINCGKILKRYRCAFVPERSIIVTIYWGINYATRSTILWCIRTEVIPHHTCFAIVRQFRLLVQVICIFVYQDLADRRIWFSIAHDHGVGGFRHSVIVGVLKFMLIFFSFSCWWKLASCFRQHFFTTLILGRAARYWCWKSFPLLIHLLSYYYLFIYY